MKIHNSKLITLGNEALKKIRNEHPKDYNYLTTLIISSDRKTIELLPKIGDRKLTLYNNPP